MAHQDGGNASGINDGAAALMIGSAAAGERAGVKPMARILAGAVSGVDPRVNPNGGAIAIGHPLGASGARLVLTAARELERRGGRYAVVSLCIGVGQGIALILERV